MGLFERYLKRKLKRSEALWKEFGRYNAIFTPFSGDMWQSDLVRSCIRPLSEHTSKALAVSNNEAVAKILNHRPNRYMNGKDFLAKVRIWLEIKNNSFIMIDRDDKGNLAEVYPIPYTSLEAIESNGVLFIKFGLPNAGFLTVAWDDLAVLRKDYYTSEIWGDDNSAIYGKLSIIDTMDQGVDNAVKSTANLRGIIKSTKAMLASEEIKKQKDDFIRDYMNLENSGGIASLDATQEFTPITMNPTVVDAQTRKEFREDVFRYFGVNDKILMSCYDEDTMEAFYQSRIEPFLIAISQESTSKILTQRQRDLKQYIVYQGDHLRFVSNSNKLKMVALVDRAIMTPNEVRAMYNLKPYEGGDEFQRRLDTAATGAKKGEKTNGSNPED